MPDESRPLNKAIDVVDDLLEAHHDYENSCGRQTFAARDDYQDLRAKVIELVDRAMRDEMTDSKPIPMGCENPNDDFAIGYMCLTDFEHGCASGGNVIYPSIEDCRANRKCVSACGIVEVEVRARRIVSAPRDEANADDSAFDHDFKRTGE